MRARTDSHVRLGSYPPRPGGTTPGPEGSYGPDIIDRWKARAFQQDPSSETPCCGYEEEDTNWGGSSTLLGERSGPVRTIRETWGADSGTNVTKTETFYRDAVTYRYRLRVHPIPPDGIYTSWVAGRHPGGGGGGAPPGRFQACLRASLETREEIAEASPRPPTSLG